MNYFLLITLVLISTQAHAEFGFGQTTEKPQTMMVAGGSVIEEDNINTDQTDKTKVLEINDDAHSMMKPEKTPPPTPEINAFAPPPETPVEQKKNIKRVLKKIPAAKVERSIADDRIDDGYVQQLMKKNFDYSGPIE